MTSDPSSGVRGRQDKAAATKRQLIAAATAEFSEQGYRATTVRAITNRAQTAHGTFYLYFRNTEEIFCAVVEGVIIERLLTVSSRQPAQAPFDELRDWVRTVVLVIQDHAGLWAALLEGMLQSEDVRGLWLGLRRQLVSALADAFIERQEGGVMPTFDAIIVAHSLFAMLEWSTFTHLALGEPVPDAQPDVERLVSAMTEAWYRSVYGTMPEQLAPWVDDEDQTAPSA